jgi:hypothetical protein
MVIGKKIKLFISGTPPSIHFTPGVVYLPAKRGSGSSFHLGKLFMSGMHVYLVCVFLHGMHFVFGRFCHRDTAACSCF